MAQEDLLSAHNNKPIAMCGITPMDKYMHTGKIWFLGTDDVDKIWKSFYKHSKLILKFLVYRNMM